MIKIGVFNTLQVLRNVEIGLYLDDGKEGILLPRKYAPKSTRKGHEVEVFLYHDSENRIIATTLKPKGIVGDIIMLECVDVTRHGAFLDWGLEKDLFVATSQLIKGMQIGEKYLVKIYLDEQTGRVAATERIASKLSNEYLTVSEREEVDMVVYRKTEIGYAMIVNNVHIGLLHFNEVFKPLQPGDKLKGFIKTILPENKLDVVLGKPGYARVEDELDKVIRLLKENDGFLPYHDKSVPEDIYAFFGMSKKTFKMTVGTLFKQRKITISDNGITLV